MKKLFKGIALFAVMLVIPFISAKAITYDNTLPDVQDLKVYENGNIKWNKSTYAFHIRIQNDLSAEYSTSLLDSADEPPINLIELIESRCPSSLFGCDGSKTGTFKVLIQETANGNNFNNTEFQVTYDGTKLSGTIVEQETYTVTFDSNGGSAVASQTVTAGNTITIPEDPTREGYDFLYWAPITVNLFDPITSDITFTAQWLKRFEVLTGEKATFFHESDKDLIVKVDAPLEDLEDVSIFDRSTDDLISIGTIGLIKGVNTYKNDKNIKLATYASRCIDNEILMFLRKNKKRKGEVSLEDSLSYDAEGNELHLEDLVGTDANIVSKGIEDETDKRLMYEELNKLNDRDKKIISLRYGLMGYSEMTQKDVANMLGISQSYISRIEKKVISKLKNITKI